MHVKSLLLNYYEAKALRSAACQLRRKVTAEHVRSKFTPAEGKKNVTEERLKNLNTLIPRLTALVESFGAQENKP